MNEFIKKPALIQKIESSKSTPVVVDDFMDSNTLDILIAIKTKCYSDQDSCHPKLFKDGKPRGLTATPNNEIKSQLDSLLKKKLSKHLGSENSFEVEYAFHRNYFPYGIHTDSGYDPNEKIYRQGIIPLEVYPSDKSVYTVIFDQKVYHSIGFTREDSIFKQSGGEFIVNDYSSAQDAKILNEEKHLWQGQLAWLEELSVSLAFEWRVGQMAIWDRSHLHCSSDFKTSGVEYKLGLMWISKLIS